MEDIDKKKRGENWNPEDKSLLMQLIRSKVEIIENKNTDSNTNYRKIKAWEEIQERFNQIVYTKRTINQLKCQWNTIKVAAKKEKSHQKAEICKTGRGSLPQEETASADDICDWLAYVFTVKYKSFDLDKYLEEAQQFDSPEAMFTPSIEANTTDEQSNEKGEETDIKNSETSNISTAKTASHISTAKTAPTTLIEEAETKCRLELHELQMENERKRGRNLDLEHEILLIKMKRIKDKNFSTKKLNTRKK